MDGSPLVAIAEDDVALRDLLRRGLAEEGFAVLATASGGELLAALERRQPQALVLDIGLPDADGRDVCHALRARGIDAPVIFLTARDGLSDRLAAFHSGADDFLAKPFAFDELVVRLRALVRRGGGAPSIANEGLRLDPASHAVHSAGSRAALTPTEFRLLAALAARPDEVLRREELIRAAWPAGAVVHDNTLDSYVARLRRKLRTIGRDDLIATAHGIGYRLK